jgi:penicillin-binding protein 2
MENKKKLLIRLVVLSIILLGGGLLICYTLANLQITNGEEYRAQTEKKLSGMAIEHASRGEILDRYGRPLVTNETVYSVRIDYIYWDQEKQDENILYLYDLVSKDGGEISESLPISQNQPYTYTKDEDSSDMKALRSYCEEKEWGASLTAEQTMEKLDEEFEITGDVPQEDVRKIVGVRYEMVRTQFSAYNSYTFAKDISIDLVSKIKEQHSRLPGVSIDVSSERKYTTDYAAHILGRVGPIYAEEWDQYKEEGYAKNAIVGKDGMEKVLEPYLKSTNGIKSYETGLEGENTQVTEANAAVPGKNCMLTIDLDLQKVAEDSLAKTIKGLPYATGGAVAAIDVNTGDVLAIASYPTYKLETFNQDYEKLAKDSATPMLNRAINGTYAPGSTYKICTAVAGLEEGVINGNTTVYCKGVYDYYDYHPKCEHHHGIENVTTAIRDSCNIFFYETGNRLGASKLETWAHRLGLGEKTGIELNDSKGMVAGPANTEALREKGVNVNEWKGGNTLQAAIGQSDNQFTPLQLANYLATVVNGGTRYEAHLLKSVKEYDYSSTYLNVEPKEVEKVSISDRTYNFVMKGMNAVVNEGGTAATVFGNYPIKIGGKSGTAQVRGIANGVFIAFAPFDHPEIAVCVVGEHAQAGYRVAPVIRDIFDAYFGRENSVEGMDSNYTLVQ